jgi:hypothetical protein
VTRRPGRKRLGVFHDLLSDGITDGERAMTQNIYDHEEFFERYSQLGRSVEGLDGAPE